MKASKIYSPVILRMFLKKLVNRLEHDALIGDFDEIYGSLIKERGFLTAFLWYIMQICRAVPIFIANKTQRSLSMFFNYLKITIRNILRHKGYSFINIFGLALGMACCIFITLWVMDELSYDKFHENADHLYRIEQDQEYSGQQFHVNVTPFPLGPALKEQVPEIIDATRYTGPGQVLVKYGNSSFYESGIRSVDPSFLNMFTFPIVRGNDSTPLETPLSIIITEEMADKYFPGEEPVGKILNLNNMYDLTVTAVMKDIPDNSAIQFDMLVPVSFVESNRMVNISWGNNNLRTFIQLEEGADFQAATEKADAILDERRRRGSVTLILAPYKDVYLHGYFGFEKSMGAVQYVYIFSVIAVLVLLIACINFMNLSTARSVNRAKEIGMRKVSGAVKSNIVTQFFGESVVMSFIALAAALVFVTVFMSMFNDLSGKTISLGVLAQGKIIGILLLTALITGVVSGIYPAFVPYQPSNR
ncbi:MAG: FtsX-like permease family protein [bacterium]|nr:FtsX-like permease family protein [bacterium]